MPLRFAGQYHDTETGLYYNYNRYYNPDTGRYITTDPLGLTPSPNPHTYVTNPTTTIDPLGLSETQHGLHGIDAVDDPSPVTKPSGAPDRTSAVYVAVRRADGSIEVVGSRPGGFHAEDVSAGA